MQTVSQVLRILTPSLYTQLFREYQEYFTLRKLTKEDVHSTCP